MPKYIFLIITILSFSISKAQNQDKVFEKIELEAHTDTKEWSEHIRKRSQLPDSLIKSIPAGNYSIKVQFIVDVHGSLGQIKAINDPGYGLAQRVANIISTYKGKWQPANQCGRNVKAYRNEVITFVIDDQ